MMLRLQMISMNLISLIEIFRETDSMVWAQMSDLTSAVDSSLEIFKQEIFLMHFLMIS